MSETPKQIQGGELLVARGITRSFGKVRALRGVDFDLLPGEVHGLLGQNGAGKSTLIKILAGVDKPSGGTIEVSGKEVEFHNPIDSRAAGIAVVHQSLSLVPTLTVAENIFLGVEPLKARMLVDNRTINRKAHALLQHYNLPLNPAHTVSSLTFAYRQLLEIAKALAKDARILILDEPTSSLSKAEESILFAAIRDATSRGIGVIYVSHRLSEIMDLTDRVTVFRDGENVGSYVTANTDIPKLVEAIVGEKVERTMASVSSIRETDATTELVLSLQGLSNGILSDVNLSLRAGEVLGLVGSTGSGRTELLETLFGIRPALEGSIILNGSELRLKSPRDALAHGIKLVPEDRHKFGLVLDHDVEHNSSMPMLGIFKKLGVIFDGRRSRAAAEFIVSSLSVKTSSIFTKMGTLSGGNQQKVMIGKWLHDETVVLLLDEPTAGVDVGARADIYRIVHDLAAAGTAILVCSSDYDELLQLCTTFALVSDGKIRKIIERSIVSDEHDLHEILEASREENVHV